MEAFRINGERLWQSLMEMARIGATPRGGVCRVALTDVDRQGRDVFIRWAREAGCEVEIDQMGNIFARRPGTDNALPPVLTGSHLDTQPTGGKFDGVYGVLAGLEVIRTLNDHGYATRHPVEAAVRRAAEHLHLPHMDMISGAGHDTKYLVQVCPSAMIFIPCKDGISHNEIEDATPEDVAAGCDVLLQAILEKATE